MTATGDSAAAGVIGVVGAGTMGAGIAQVALEADHEVVLHDVDGAALERGRGRIVEGLRRRAAKLEFDADTADEWVEGRLARLRDAATLDALGAEAGLELVIEAALEDLGLKQTIIRVLDAATAPHTILATNTSALPVSELAAAAHRRERVLGLHFFNPAPVMALVEVVAAAETAPQHVQAAEALIRSWGKTPIRVADAPGFVVNRVNRPFTIEALRLLERGEAGIEVIDGAMRDAGFPMGPFELMDLTGIDVTLAAATSIWERLGRPERLRPSPIQEQLVGAGMRGRKDGVGFYRHEGNARREPNPDVAGPAGSALAGAEIVRRIRGAIRREAELAEAERVAAREDIVLALRLGAGHPVSPFEPA
ncbi:MAG TPA: 3-hydroxyacyl-CoA dehydrogenase NAD-binding domain-containing protein [Candidatus Limnocylindrales bacterium]|nr:3-hydroxyacyl-CoA dehydrogenase NAD-binding domain-containing protein [Candidatus Limnocylindrales bacterium]